MSNYVAMGKVELRSACKAAGIPGYSKLNVQGMRDALADFDSKRAPADTSAPGTGLKIEKDRPEQNGIKRPSVGGKCREIWDALDEVRKDEGVMPDSKLVKKLAQDNGWNPNNASIEFYQWRKYHGVTGRS